MNKLIKEFVEQATLYAMSQLTHEKSIRWGEVFEQKFAELIVQECAEVAQRHTPDTEELDYGHLIKDKILERFGVEL